jgi:hypothetical protein
LQEPAGGSESPFRIQVLLVEAVAVAAAVTGAAVVVELSATDWPFDTKMFHASSTRIVAINLEVRT